MRSAIFAAVLSALAVRAANRQASFATTRNPVTQNHCDEAGREDWKADTGRHWCFGNPAHRPYMWYPAKGKKNCLITYKRNTKPLPEDELKKIHGADYAKPIEDRCVGKEYGDVCIYKTQPFDGRDTGCEPVMEEPFKEKDRLTWAYTFAGADQGCPAATCDYAPEIMNKKTKQAVADKGAVFFESSQCEDDTVLHAQAPLGKCIDADVLSMRVGIAQGQYYVRMYEKDDRYGPYGGSGCKGKPMSETMAFKKVDEPEGYCQKLAPSGTARFQYAVFEGDCEDLTSSDGKPLETSTRTLEQVFIH